MPITARLGDAVIRPFDGGIVEAMCRDPQCGAKVTAVKASIEDGDILRVAHWRHAVSQERVCASERMDRDHLSPWHAGWQSETDDPNRIEVPIRGKRADILTRFGWVIEVQHSGIKRKTIVGRESAHNGRILWLVDAASTDAPFHVDFHGDHLELIGPAWMFHVRGLMAVDDGRAVWLLPRHAPTVKRGSEIRVPRSTVTRYTRDQFAFDWINGYALPIPTDKARTLWMLERGGRPRALAPQTQQHRRVSEDDYLCHFTGDRDKLIQPDELILAEAAQSRRGGPANPVHACAGPYCRTWGCDGGAS